MKKAKQKQFGYIEPEDYFPPEVRKMFEEQEAEEEKKKNPYREQSKRLIEKQAKKK